MTTPLVIDTDIGGEPDDAMALAIAARSPELALVLTADEFDGHRARFVRAYLDLLGRSDVAVARGRQLSEAPYFWVRDLIPDGVPDQPADAVAAVVRLCRQVAGPVRWLGFGPMTNLAAVLAERPDLADRLHVTQLGGALAYRDPATAQYNFRLDSAAARTAVATLPNLRLVTYEVSFAPQLAISAESRLYQLLRSAPQPWSSMLSAHCDRYFAGYYPSTIPHTPLVLSAGLGQSFVRFEERPIVVDELGRTVQQDNGVPIAISMDADYAPFSRWLTANLEMGAMRTDTGCALQA